MKIIGVELRLQFHDAKLGPQQKEFAIIPCDVRLLLEKADEGYWVGLDPNISGTLHTDCGDLAFNCSVPRRFLDREYNRSLFSAKQEIPLVKEIKE